MSCLEDSSAFANLHSDEKIKKFYGEDATFASMVLGAESNAPQRLNTLEAIIAARLDQKDPEKFRKLAEDLYESLNPDSLTKNNFRNYQ